MLVALRRARPWLLLGALLAAYGTGRAILEAATRRGAAARFARIAAEGEGRTAFGVAVGEGIVAVAADLATRLDVLRQSDLAIGRSILSARRLRDRLPFSRCQDRPHPVARKPLERTRAPQWVPDRPR